jgi:ABC-type bacteriocin/lantibiotic exporter with double-glycine peptidase domain
MRRFMTGGCMLIVISMLLYVITIGFNLFPPLFQQVFTDYIITGKNPEWFWPLILFYGALFILELVAWLVLNSHRRKLEMRFSLVSQARYIWHALRMPMAAHNRFSSGDLIARYMGIGTTGVKLFDMAPTLTLGINVIIFSYLLFVYHWKLGLIEIAAIFVIIFSIRLSMDYQKRKARSMEATERHMQSATMAGMHSMETIKAAGAEQRFYQNWESLYTQALNARVTVTRQMILIGALPLLVQQLTAAVLLCLGTWFILKGELTPGMLLASQGFMSSMLYPITRMSSVMQDVFKAHSILERQEEVLDVEVDSEEGTQACEEVKLLIGEIELRDVTFGYDRSMPPLIEHLSLHIRPGEQVAFVGKSGCGKSTLAMLVAGLYEPWEGEVLLDGKPIPQTSRMTLTNSIGVVGQDVTLFEGTIADNIRMWDESISDEAIVHAAKCAQLHDEIADMPNTYDSLVETGGQNFSSGQRQRLEIAAALAKQPTILIMDEATATLDITTEAAIIEGVRELGITLFMIAHRLETVRSCDTIYVIDHGRVMQHGTHDSLMADTKGIYYQLNTYGNDD